MDFKIKIRLKMENYNIIVAYDLETFFNGRPNVLLNGTKAQFINILEETMLRLTKAYEDEKDCLNEGLVSYDTMFNNDLKLILFEVENNVVYMLDSIYWYKYIHTKIKYKNDTEI